MTPAEAITVPGYFWVGFIAFVIAAIAVDMGLFHRKAHVIRAKEAGIMVAVWVTLAALFGGWITYEFGTHKGLEFATGYLIELSLSIDNIFVFVMIFSHFRVPYQYQHRVLVWGILGALILRGLMIGLGAALVQEYSWVLYFFGAFLIYTGIKMLVISDKDEDLDPEHNALVKFARKCFPVTPKYHEQHFFVKLDGKWFITPLFIVVLMVETTDVMFALDSIPAIFAITTDPFIVYTANILAIMGLRSLYFLLADMVKRFQYLKIGISFLLMFVGVKLLALDVYHIPTGFSLAFIVLTIATSVFASLYVTRKRGRKKHADGAGPVG